MEKQQFLEIIASNIRDHGYHVTIVTGAPYPRFAYTIGLWEKLGYELLFAGCEQLSAQEIKAIINIFSITSFDNNPESVLINVDNIGDFTILEADLSWISLLLLGAFDYYQISEIKAYQIIPSKSNKTLDTPNTARKFNMSNEPIWKWLTLDWPYPVPRSSIAIIDVEALHGRKITEATRWEIDEWELFSSSDLDVDKENTCVVPLGTILGIDNSIEPALNLQIGKGIWRDDTDLIWHEWN